MHLEVISKPAAEGAARPPVVLVHGAWHGAWCWENNFLDYFPARGWETHAFSFRGHGTSDGAGRLRRWSIADYVEDLAQVVSTLGRPPILVGHSMGGFVIQKFLENHSVCGAVLLASGPPSGILRFQLRLVRRHPLVWLRANLLMNLYALVATPELAGELFYSPGVSDEMLRTHHAKLQNESYRAALDMLVLDLPDPGRVTTPVAVLGGAADRIFSVQEVLGTGRAYGVEAKIFPGMAHNMMSEPGWEAVAEWILDWAAARGTDPGGRRHGQ